MVDAMFGWVDRHDAAMPLMMACVACLAGAVALMAAGTLACMMGLLETEARLLLDLFATGLMGAAIVPAVLLLATVLAMER